MRLPLPPLLALAALPACMTGPAIEPMATHPDVWVVTREAPAGVLLKGKLKADTLEEARRHCEARQATMQVVDAQASSTWNVAGNSPTYQVRFRCVPGEDSGAR